MTSDEEFQLQNHLGLDLIMREYRETDSPQCCALDEKMGSVSMHGSQVIIAKKYIDTFHSVFQQSHEYFGIVLEDRTLKEEVKLIGMIFLTIRNVIYQNKEIKIGHIHSLRVDKEYRRFGLAAKLVEALEKKAKDRGVTMIEAFAPKDSSPGVKLYEKLNYRHDFTQGWGIWDPKHLPHVPHKFKINKNLRLTFETIDKQTTKKYWEEFYNKSDLLPANWDDVLNSTEFKASYLVKSQDNSIMAGITRGVMKTNKISIYQKYYVPISYYNSIFFNGILLAVTTGASFGLHFILTKMFNVKKKVTDLAAALFGGIALTLYARFRSKILANEKESHAKSNYLIAPFYFGDEKYEELAIKYLFDKVADTAKKDGPVHLTFRAEEEIGRASCRERV